MPAIERDPNRLFATPNVELRRRADGTLVFRSLEPLEAYGRCLGDWLADWAHRDPGRPFLFERGPDDEWRRVTYSEALDQVRRIGAWLLSRNACPERPVAILSENSVQHALLALGAMYVGVPAMPVSPAYSLVSRDFGKLKTVVSSVPPSVIYVADGEQFAPALKAIEDLVDAAVVVGTAADSTRNAIPFPTLLDFRNEGEVDRAFAAVGPDTVAKLLFTSGSTGSPKAVLNTQRMLCANQQQMAQLWPFTAVTPPVIVDWLPWSHTFGGNHNFNLILKAGGSLYIDRGRPLPGAFEQTVANLSEVAPTIYFNVPRGYDMLVAALRRDERLRTTFFSRLQLIFYAAAALPQNLWDALGELSEETLGARIPMVSAWGSTETAPLASSCHFQAQRAGNIGVPVPGCDLKLVPSGEKLEVRVRGPNVTPGYWGEPELTEQSFDDEGFYRIGDAVALVDRDRPELGLLFDGRVAEDFKLLSGTWVSSGNLRVSAVAALAPIAQDAVVTGHDRDELGLLVFPNVGACRELCGDQSSDAPLEQLFVHPAIRARVHAGLRELRRSGTGSSTYATRAYLMTEPPSIDAGEITDKGYINQRAVLERRSHLVEELYAVSPGPEVITLEV